MNKEWSEKNKLIQHLLKKSTFSEGIKELLNLREMLINEVILWQNEIDKKGYSACPFINADGYHNATIAYSLWHIFRIEDIVVHTLILKDEQIFFSRPFQKMINSSIITTGNELVKEQIVDFSKRLNIDSLYEYIFDVKKSSDKWLMSIDYQNLKVRFSDSDKTSITKLNVVSTEKSASWLIDYWCNNNIKGLIQMPLSRHWIMHIEAALRIKNKIKKSI